MAVLARDPCSCACVFNADSQRFVGEVVSVGPSGAVFPQGDPVGEFEND